MKAQAPTITKERGKTGAAIKALSGSSRPGKARRTNKPSTSQLVRRPWGEPLLQHDLDLIKKLIKMPESEINLKDIPEVKLNTFENKSGIHSSGLFKPYKQQITLRIDSDIIAWARRDGEGYQSRINAALRKVMMESIQANGAK